MASQRWVVQPLLGHFMQCQQEFCISCEIEKRLVFFKSLIENKLTFNPGLIIHLHNQFENTSNSLEVTSIK